MDTYRDMLLMACCHTGNTASTLFNVAIQLSLLDELKELDGWIDDGTPISLDVLFGMNDPLLLKMATVIHTAHEVLSTIHNLNSFTKEELMTTEGGNFISKDEKQPVYTRILLLNGLLDYYYAETSQVEFYLGEMCFINGYSNRLTHAPGFDYCSEEYYGDENIKQLSRFCRIMSELMDYIEGNEPGLKFSGEHK